MSNIYFKIITSEEPPTTEIVLYSVLEDDVDFIEVAGNKTKLDAVPPLDAQLFELVLVH